MRKIIATAIVLLGLFAPLAFLAVLFSWHGMSEGVFDYTPVWRDILWFAAAPCLVLIVASLEYIRKRSLGWSVPIAALVLLVTVFLTLYLAIPRLIRHGDVQPQLILTGGSAENGTPKMAVAFWTERPMAAQLTWGRKGAVQQTETEPSPARKHWFILAGLEPGTEYTYAVKGEPPTSFRTPPAGWPLRFAAGGDPHGQAFDSRTDRTIRLLEQIKDPANNFSLFFLLGDAVQLGFNDSMWKQTLLTLSVLTSVVPTGYVVGNHDVIFGGVGLFRDYLEPPDEKRLWRRIDRGQVHFLLLDLEWGAAQYTAEQASWLKDQLALIPRTDWCVVMSHTFYYCSGERKDGWDWFDNKPLLERLTPLFESSGVDLVLSGHKHQTEVLRHNGVTYAVVGSLGGVLDGGRQYISPASLWYQTEQHAFADIKLDDLRRGSIAIRDDRGSVLFQTGLVNR